MRLRVICIGLVPIPIVLPLPDQPTLCLLWWANKNTHRVLSGQGNEPPPATTVPLMGLQMMFAN